MIANGRSECLGIANDRIAPPRRIANGHTECLGIESGIIASAAAEEVYTAEKLNPSKQHFVASTYDLKFEFELDKDHLLTDSEL